MAQSFQSATGPTAADRTLATAASNARRREVTDWQIKRWREWGLLPTTRRFLGRGRGSEPAEFLANGPQHAACLAGAFERGLGRHEACLLCFLRGFSPQERALKSAYGTSFRQIARWVERTAGPGADKWAAAEAVAAVISRRSAAFPRMRAARARVRASGKPPRSLRDALINTVSVALGAPAQLRPDTLIAFGMEGLRAPVAGTEPLASDDDLNLGWLSLTALAASVKQSALGELEHARDDFLTLREVASLLVSALVRTRGLRFDLFDQLITDDPLLALIGIPATLLMRKRVTAPVFEQNLEELRANLPRLHAFHRLLDAIPPDLHRYAALDATQLEALREPERERFATALQTYFSAHPDDFALLAAPTTTDDTTEQP
jgi:hypothetical protein